MSDQIIRKLFHIVKESEGRIKEIKSDEECSDGIRSDLINSIQSMAYTQIKSELKKYKKQQTK